MQMISYSFCNPKAFSDQFTISKDIDADRPIDFFFFLGGGWGQKIGIIPSAK